MNQLNIIFKIATAIALIGWLAILALPGWRYTDAVVWKLVIVNLGKV